MRPEENKRNKLDEAIEQIKNEPIDPAMIEKAGQRVWARVAQEMEARPAAAIEGCAGFQALIPAYREGKLNEARALLVRDHLHECVACRKVFMKQTRSPRTAPRPRIPRFAVPKWAIAALILIVAGFGGWELFNLVGPPPDGPAATVASVDGSLYRVNGGETIAIEPGAALEAHALVRVPKGTNASLRLRDGSLVELRERSDFTITETRRDVTIRLARGSVIVEAAKRASGHLYVSTRDCRVAVTGTVFAVNSGLKGSRVSVVEGEVHVAQGASEAVLGPGDQYSSNPHLAKVPVAREIAWSQNADKYIALMKELAALGEEMEIRVPMPGARYTPALAKYLPADTALYAAVPNLGETMAGAYEVFRRQLAGSPVLQEWWNEKAGAGEGEETLRKVVGELRRFGGYIGEEIVIAAAINDDGKLGAPAILGLVKPGFAEFVQSEMQQFGDAKYTIAATAATIPAEAADGIIFYVNESYGVAAVSPDAAALRRLATAIESGGNGFTGTPFFNQIASAYQQGASFLFSADLDRLKAGEQDSEILGNIEYMVVSQKQDGAEPDTRALVTFAGPRTGISSWLDAPGPIGALEFISAEARIVTAFSVKEPVAVIDDLMAKVSGISENLAAAEAQVGLGIRQDIAAAFGHEFVVALDGPVLPVPSWKVVAEVRSAELLQNSLERLVAAAGVAARDGGPAPVLAREDVSGRAYFSLGMPHGGPVAEMHYAFVDGYMIAAPSRVLIDQAVSIRDSRSGILTSERFTQLLPRDGHNNFSALVYHNVGPVAGPLMEALTPEQQQAAEGLESMMEPALVLAYAAEDNITAATRSKVFGFTPGNLFGLRGPLGLGAMMGGRGPAPEAPATEIQ